MGWWLFEEDFSQWGRFCRECGYYQMWENFYNNRGGRNGKHSICKECLYMNKEFCRRYRIHHIVPQECEGCGRKGQIEVDHDHDTMQFRAWLCRTCNRNNRRWDRVHASM